MSPEHVRECAVRIVECLAEGHIGLGLHPGLTLALLRRLVMAAREDGIPTVAYHVGPWRARTIACSPAADGVSDIPAPAACWGPFAIPAATMEEARDTAAVLNWCGLEDPPLAH